MKQLWKELVPKDAAGHACRRLSSTIYTDNRAAIQISSNNSNHGRSKHIDLRFHFVRDDLLRGEYELNWIPGEENEADMFTKALGPIKYEAARNRITQAC